MGLRSLYEPTDKLLSNICFMLIIVNAAAATIGMLYLQDPFETVVQYLPTAAGVLYFVSRFLFIKYHGFAMVKNELFGFLFIVSTAVALLGQSMLDIDFIDQKNRSSFVFTVNFWAFSVGYFFAGASVSRVNLKKSNTVALILVLIVVIPLLKSLEGKLFLDYYLMRIKLDNPDFTHLYVSEFCVFLFFVAFAFANNLLRPLIIVVAFLALFSLQGRSSTFFATSTLLLMSFQLDRKRFFIGLVAIVAIAFAIYYFAPLEDLLKESNEFSLERMLISSEEGDDSAEGRSMLLEESVPALKDAVLFGNPAYIAEAWGHMGSYIHNLLSMWQFFGLVPFLLMVVILYRGIQSMRAVIKMKSHSVVEEIAAMVLIYSTVGVILTKPVLLNWLWFAAGFWMLRYSAQSHSVGRSNGKRKKRKRSSRRRGTFRSGGKIRFG